MLNSFFKLPEKQTPVRTETIAVATMFGALMGTSTAYIESAAGIAEGGRTGLSSVITGILFLAAALYFAIPALVKYFSQTPRP